MTGFWILILIFSTIFQPGRLWVTAQSVTEPPVYQPDEELSVDIGDSATLQCCVSEKEVEIIAWFKQPNRKKQQIIAKVYIRGGEVFYTGFQKSHFQIERSSPCFSMTILNITQSDEAMYYCAITHPYTAFADGTYLKIKGEHVTISSETSNMNQQKNTVSEIIRSLHWTVIGLGTAFGLCALLIFYLTYFILRRRKCDQMNASMENSPGMRQEYEDETLNYAALKFSQQKTRALQRQTDPLDECVYSDVNTAVSYTVNDS